MIEPSLIAYVYLPNVGEVPYQKVALHLYPEMDLMTVLQLFTVSPAGKIL